MTRNPIEDADHRIHSALDRASQPAITCSFQPGGIAVLHLMGDRRRDVVVLFADTGYHFQETLEFKDDVAELWDLDVRLVRSHQTPESQQDYVGPLYRTNPDQCCEDRKTGPLFAALNDFDTWFTGLRREQTEDRTTADIVERRILPSGRVITKVNPIADWTARDLEAYTATHGIPVHPLLGQGYPSIGCAPCTRAAPDGTRSGRWAGLKAECGIHTRLAGRELDG
jgi:phosphoadenosine phosphosulfate reductase